MRREPVTLLEAQQRLSDALLELLTLVLLIVATPRALITIAALGFGLAGAIWFALELYSSIRT